MFRHLLPLVLIAAVQSGSCASPGSPPAATPPGQTTQPVKTEAQCVDDWIAKNHLNQYGDPEGTMYMGATPLFDEASGHSKDRLEYIYEKHPDVKATCRR